MTDKPLPALPVRSDFEDNTEDGYRFHKADYTKAYIAYLDARLRVAVGALERVRCLAHKRRRQTGLPSQGHEDYELIAEACLHAIGHLPPLPGDAP